MRKLKRANFKYDITVNKKHVKVIVQYQYLDIKLDKPNTNNLENVLPKSSSAYHTESYDRSLDPLFTYRIEFHTNKIYKCIRTSESKLAQKTQPDIPTLS